MRVLGSRGAEGVRVLGNAGEEAAAAMRKATAMVLRWYLG
jgi:hypothetical protein